MTPQQARRWHSWEGYCSSGAAGRTSVATLPRLLCSEEPSFVRYVERLAASASAG